MPRELEIAGALALALACTSGCRSSETAGQPSGADAGVKPPPEPTSDTPPAEAPAPSPDPAELQDLDELCAALDHDYVDGTLTDYYAKVSMQTDWGEAQRKAGDESIRPGRLLERAVAELSPGAQAPELSHCRTLLDYLDDVE